RTGPAGHLAVLDLDDGAGRAHAGVRLEWPFIFSFDHACGGPERLVGIADRSRIFTLAYRRLADVVVERSGIGERRLGIRPFDLELLRRLDRIPFLVRHNAEEALLPNRFGTRELLDRAFI